ncbi:hypothetical protein D039_1397B, partial [Vibrio parahaemolyticus EKP-028]
QYKAVEHLGSERFAAKGGKGNRNERAPLGSVSQGRVKPIAM